MSGLYCGCMFLMIFCMLEAVKNLNLDTFSLLWERLKELQALLVYHLCI